MTLKLWCNTPTECGLLIPAGTVVRYLGHVIGGMVSVEYNGSPVYYPPSKYGGIEMLVVLMVFVDILRQVGIAMLAAGVSTYLVLRHLKGLDLQSRQISKNDDAPVRATSDTRKLTIDEAIDRLKRARTLIGGDKVLIACLVGSQMEDTDDVWIDVVNEGDNRYVEVAVRHPGWKDDLDALGKRLRQEIRRGSVSID